MQKIFVILGFRVPPNSHGQNWPRQMQDLLVDQAHPKHGIYGKCGLSAVSTLGLWVHSWSMNGLHFVDAKSHGAAILFVMLYRHKREL